MRSDRLWLLIVNIGIVLKKNLKFMLKKQSRELEELKNLVNDKFLDKFD